MTKTFCDRCEEEAHVVPLILSNRSTTLAMIEVCERCEDIIVRKVVEKAARTRK